MTQSSSNTSSQSTTAPGAMTAPTVQGIADQLNPLIANSGLTPTQSSAINQLTQNAEAGDPYAAAEGANATNLLNGGGATSENGNLTSNLATLQKTLSPYTDPNYSTVNSQPVQQALQAANAGIQNSVNGQFAAAGRSGSGANAGNLAYNEELADAPILLNQANTDTATRIGAANTLYGAGNTTSGAITGNNQTALGNEVQGINSATGAIAAQNEGPTAAIEAQELGQEIPAQNLGLLANIGIPLAGLNTTTNGTSNTTTNPSLLSSIAGLGSAAGALGTGLGTSAGVNAAGVATNGSGILGLLGAL
jgi:hypothetical protein